MHVIPAFPLPSPAAGGGREKSLPTGYSVPYTSSYESLSSNVPPYKLVDPVLYRHSDLDPKQIKLSESCKKRSRRLAL